MTLKAKEKISFQMDESKIDRFKYRDYNPEIVEENEKNNYYLSRVSLVQI